MGRLCLLGCAFMPIYLVETLQRVVTYTIFDGDTTTCGDLYYTWWRHYNVWWPILYLMVTAQLVVAYIILYLVETAQLVVTSTILGGDSTTCGNLLYLWYKLLRTALTPWVPSE